MPIRSTSKPANTNGPTLGQRGGFWSSKLGAASLASVAAMSAMVILSSQVHTDPVSGTQGAALFQQHAETPALIEIA